MTGHRRSSTLAAGSLMLAAVLVGAGSTQAAAGDETCLGKPATIVGSGPLVVGTEGPDVIVAVRGDLREVRGLGGDDAICVVPGDAGDAAVEVDAGEGIDQVLLSHPRSGDVLEGGPGADTIIAHAAGDSLDLDLRTGALHLTRPATGTPQVRATGFEHATLVGRRLTARGDAGDNNLRLLGCQVDARGGPGDDWIQVGPDHEDDQDFLCARSSARLYGGAGDDHLRGSEGADQLWGGPGDDRIWGRGGDDRIQGGPGHDRIAGGTGDDRIWGAKGRDRLWGGKGDDRIWGGPGQDRIWGGPGDDRLWGGPGADKVRGGPGGGDDCAWGGSGRDLCRGTTRTGCEN